MEIRKLKNARFGAPQDYVVIDREYALYEPGKGYISLGRTAYGVRIPYLPQGGRKALQAIIAAGGFAGNVTYVNPI